MRDRPRFNHTAMSFAYLRRGELPSVGSGFYRDAGMSKQEFEVARAAQIVPRPVPERFRHIEDSGGRRARTYRHVFPQPRPDFAPPDRRLYEEDWFQKNRRPQNANEPQKSRARKHIRRR